MPGAALADAYFAELDKFRGSTAITDDQTVVAMKVVG
jgi:serine phosphatase RsbU (regulator of sigma subunit)